MHCSRLHAWWSTQSRLASLLSFLIARQWVRIQTLWRFWLKYLSIDKMVGAWCFGCYQAHRGLAVGFFAQGFSFIYCCVLILTLSPFYILIYILCTISLAIILYGWFHPHQISSFICCHEDTSADHLTRIPTLKNAEFYQTQRPC